MNSIFNIHLDLRLVLLIFLITNSCDKDSSADSGEKEPQEFNVVFGSITPMIADLGDTLTLKGKNFRRNIALGIEHERLDIVFNNDSLVKFKVPYQGFDPSNFSLLIDNGDAVRKIDTIHSPFKLYLPIVDSIPFNLKPDNEIVIYGKHLTNWPTKKTDIVYLNEEQVTVISHSKDSISFKLPNNLTNFDNDILIKAQLQEVELLKGLKIPKPLIKGVSKNEVKVGDELMVHVSDFFPSITGIDKFYLSDLDAEILNLYKDSIQIKIPLGPYKDREIGDLKIEVFNAEFAANLDLNLISKWYLWDYKHDYELTNGIASVGNLTFWSFYDNNIPYFNFFKNFNNNTGLFNNVFYKYSPENSTWEEMVIPISTEGMVFGNVFYFFPLNDGENAYLYISKETDNFYKYNFENNTITQLKDFVNGELIKQPTGFVQDGSLYFGLGMTGNTQVYQNRKIWKYQEADDSWVLVSEIPLINDFDLRNGPSIFKFNDKFYIGNGEGRTKNFWEFTPENTWVRKADIPNPTQYAINIQIDNRGFYYNDYLKNFWEYNVSLDQWFERNDLIAEGYSFGHEYMFVHNNYVYLVGWQNYYPPNNSPFFQYDHIILRTELSNF